MRFRDRQEAGRLLAVQLEPYRTEKPIILAIPRGGVEVGYEVAKVLGVPLDVAVVRKIGAPDNPEFAVGAMAPGEIRVLNKPVLEKLGLTEADLEPTIAAEKVEMERRLHQFRGSRFPLNLRNRTVLLVDDGLATGMTTLAAIKAIRTQRPRKLVLAVPVGASETVETLRPEVDDLICLSVPSSFEAVSRWYDEFRQVSDAEVTSLLAESRRDAPAGTGRIPTRSRVR